MRQRQTLDEISSELEASQVIKVRQEPRCAPLSCSRVRRAGWWSSNSATSRTWTPSSELCAAQRMLTIVLRRSAKAERHDFGRFFYRFPTGESGAAVHEI